MAWKRGSLETEGSLAWAMLSHDRTRLVGSILGIAFAVLLLFAELGFLNGVYDSTTVPLSRLNADLVMIHRMKENMFPLTPFPLRRLVQARAVRGIGSTHALYIRNAVEWKTSSQPARPVRIFAFDPRRAAFELPSAAGAELLLAEPDTTLFDARSRRLYGNIGAGTRGELAGRALRIVGNFRMGSDLAFFGNMILSEETYLRLPEARREEVELGLIELDSGADANTVKLRCAAVLEDDVLVLDKAELVARVQDYWRANEPAGTVFGIGMAVGFVVGIMICCEVLFNQVTDHLPQLATLRAVGYPGSFLVRLVMLQACALALVGFIPGLLASFAVYRGLQSLSGIQMWLTPGRVGMVLVLTVFMCVISAGLAARKALRTDPAELF
jgi:putative ABC transport system permease protein